MYIKDLTTEEFQNLIRSTVIDTLNNYLVDAEDQLEVLPQIQEKLLQIQKARLEQDTTLSVDEAYAELDLD